VRGRSEPPGHRDYADLRHFVGLGADPLLYRRERTFGALEAYRRRAVAGACLGVGGVVGGEGQFDSSRATTAVL